MISFELEARSGHARKGRIQTRRGLISTPVFMPVGTLGTVRAMSPEELRELGASIVLGNAYHLHLRPGDELVRQLGGLHRFMGWTHPILTDSGGFQVFSLAKLRKLSEDGVVFQSHLNGDAILLTPEKSIQIQENLGSDIMMCFDECVRLPASYEEIEKSLSLTSNWAKRCKSVRTTSQALFAIVQGGLHLDLRKRGLEELLQIGFDGYAIGGLSVGESKEETYGMLAEITPLLPERQPRYVMGIGEPEDLLEAIEYGIDMFDCVLPTRNARNGCLYTSRGKISVKQAQYRKDPLPADLDCVCYVCRNFSRAYLRHLHLSREVLSVRLNTYHNLFFYLNLVQNARNAIENQQFAGFKQSFLQKYNSI